MPKLRRLQSVQMMNSREGKYIKNINTSYSIHYDKLYQIYQIIFNRLNLFYPFQVYDFDSKQEILIILHFIQKKG
jgi:hypothetical protein